MRPVILVCTEIPSLPGPPNPFLLNALKLFHWSSLKAQSRHDIWTPLEGSTQLPRLQARRRRCWFDEGGLRDPSKCPSCLLRGACEAPQGGCQLQTHRFFLSPLMKLLSSVPSLSVCWTLSMCQMPSPFQHLWHCLLLYSKADDTTLMAESEEELKSLNESERGEWKSWLKTQHSKNKNHGIQSHLFIANRWGTSGNNERLYILGLQNHCRWWFAAMKLKDACSLEEKLWQT